ncbi:hypothetical protein M8C21_014143 [Ambrosia artemisiifolia]|uniref:Knl1 C-terminal RWD domain-containing protein n=1 Tax=Ambrosia artemisiifolia TaxID=4212 RepID=A0AAD5BSB4_AMBAR|nr:hypothetical protein M8C21_014143 [Ambrosia artemisiifolia]
MTSPAPPEDQSNTKTEEETTAFHKKRSRRVSFAENTSVHFFNRDEDLETPPDPEPPTPPSERDSDNEEDDDDMDDNGSGPKFPFIRVVGSPSSGGSTASATSNDEDNFFGPVSTSFIRRDFLDSASPDDNHDQTMDSTAFSMHFHSFARSDSEDLRSSTRVPLSFEEKTPTSSSIPSGTRNTMQLTLVNKPSTQPDVSTSKLSSGSQSNDMSLVGEYHDKYDYGKLSSAMDPLLAEDHTNLHSVSHISVLKSPTKAGKQNGNGPDLMDISYGQDNNIKGITSDGGHKEVVSVKQNEMGVADDGSKLLPNKQIAFSVLSHTFDTQASKLLSPKQSIRGTLTVTTNEPVKDAFGTNSRLEFLATSQRTPSNHMNMVHRSNDVVEKENESPLVGSITHLTDRPSHMLLNGAGLFKSPATVTPSNNPASFVQRASDLSLQKSISKLGILEASPFCAALSAKLEDSNPRSLAGISKMTPLGNLLDKEGASANLDGTKTETPKNLVPKESCAEVASQLVLPSENTRSGEHMHQTVVRSPGYKDDENKIVSPQTFNTSSKKLKKATPAKLGVNPNRDEEQPIQHSESLESATGHVGALATASDGMGKGRGNSTPVNVAGSNIEEMVQDKGDSLFDVHNNSETRGNLANLSNNIEHEKLQPVLRGSDISIGRMKAFLSVNGGINEKSSHKNLADQFGSSPSNKEPYSVLHSENNDTFHEENVLSEVSSAERKRKAEHVTTDKIAKIQKSSNSGLELPSDNGMQSTGPNLEHLTEIHTRFFKETNLLSHSVDKMNLHAIDRMVDVLGQLQRLKTYELLSNEIRSQDKKAAETKLILCKFVHEQAKLQLMHVKRERLLKNVNSLASGIRESETLKLNSSQNSLDVQVIHQQSLPDNSKDIQECQVDKDKMTSMTQAIKDTDKRISNLTKSFHISCKMKGEPNIADTVAYANTYLMKRAHCQIIRKDLQLWVIDNLKSGKDHQDVVINYLDLIFQRFTITAGVVPRISISITLNQMNIHKNFKDVEASTALGFVFDTGLVQKHVTATSMAHETQMTSSILGNLVDVMEEIQLAKIELKNLIYARFRTSLDERLDLELYFFDSNSRKKATITLNTSCLKRGIYPAEIVACQIDVSVAESQTSSNEKFSAEIAAAVENLRVGFLRILRLCRCISQLVSLQGKK